MMMSWQQAPPPCQTLSKVFYISQGRSLKALVLLSLGLANNDGSPIFNLLVLPWSAALRPSALKMSAKELRSKVLRRCVAAKNIINAPRPSQWTVTKAMQLLVDNPIVPEDDMDFIK